jgi:hypothetical protein
MRRGLKRVPVSGAAMHRTSVKTLPSPTRGWILNENLAASKAGGARVLDNWFPTQTGIRVRGGKQKYATISTGPVLSMWNYKSGATEKFFAADEENIFDITTVADETVIPSAAVAGQAAGYYSTTQFGTAGGDYLIAVNGVDRPLLYDGADWVPVDTATLSIPYDAQSGAFTVGEVITGGTSSATATIVSDQDDGVTGVLRVKTVTGTFVDNETITDPVTGSATTNIPTGATPLVAITGVDTSDLSHVWAYASRVFFVEKNTMNAWYLPVDSLGGAADTISLAGVFQNGGSLLFGATWSIDAGDGLDDKCIFVSTEGEIAVFQGTNPGDAASWSKVGVYQITKPLGINATMQAGGDLLVATESGVVPVSEALQKDVAALSIAAVSRNIEPAWRAGVSARRTLPWEILKWSSKSMMIVSQPKPFASLGDECFACNMETGAWCRFTGWDTRCLALYSSRGFFGSNDGCVYEMEVGGSDAGIPYTSVVVGQFDHLGAQGVTKTTMQARATFLAADPFTPQISVSSDYLVELPAVPNSEPDYSGDEWDVGLWDVAKWDGTIAYAVSTKWVSSVKTGFIHAPQVQITFGITPMPNIEMISFDMTYTKGEVGV